MKLLRVISIAVFSTVMISAQTTGDNTVFGMTGFLSQDPGNTTSIQVLTSRGLIAGVDSDSDGILEIWTSHYSGGGGVAGYEVINDSTLELMWIDSSGSTYSSGTRWVQVGDTDGDGIMEVIWFAGQYVDDPVAGLYIMESTGDNLFADPFFVSVAALGGLFNFNSMGDSSLGRTKVEHFQVYDVDNDGRDEIIYASNGLSYVTDWIDSSGTEDIVYGHSEDYFAVLSVDGELQSGFASLVNEFITSARDIDMGSVTDPTNPLFGRDNYLGGGSAISVQVADTDGDGLMEILFHAWNNFNFFIVEVTDTNTYSFGDTSNVQVTPTDRVSLKHMSAGDIDGNGKDEIYIADYISGEVYALIDLDGDATSLQRNEFVRLNAGGIQANFGTAVGDLDGDGKGDIYIASWGSDGDIVDLEYKDAIGHSDWNWDVYVWQTDSIANSGGNFAISIAVADIDGDGIDEIVTGHQGLVDSIITSVDDSTMIANPNYWPIRISKWGKGSGGILSTRNLTIITPGDYTLHPAYPNPFNPTTRIEYTLPLQKSISLTVYNLIGQEVIRLVDGVVMPAGRHSVEWDARDASGIRVASGTYIVVMRFGSFQKTQRITFLK